MKRKLNYKTLLSIAFLILIVSGSFLFPIFSNDGALDMELSQRLSAPSLEAPFGRDQNGVDVLSQVILGTKTSLTISLGTTLLSVLLGLILGTLSGYFGGITDQIIMRIVDICFSFPGLLLVLTIAAVIQSASIGSLIITLSITGWAGYARLVRGEVQSIKLKDFVQSSKSLGAKNPRLIIFHIWPNIFSPLFVQMTFGFAGVLLAESSLTFLGFGIPPTEPSWGILLSSGRQFLWEAPHISFFPGLFLFLFVLSIFVLGDEMRRRLQGQSSQVI